MTPKYPLTRTKFQVEISGLEPLPGWVRVSGIRFGTQTSPVFAQHTQTPSHLPGKKFSGPLTLVRMFDARTDLAEWAARGAEDPRNGSVIFLDYTGEESRRFNFEGAYVSEYLVSECDATDQSEGHLEETIVLVVEVVRPG
jgi:phage tail-like protein